MLDLEDLKKRRDDLTKLISDLTSKAEELKNGVLVARGRLQEVVEMIARAEKDGG